MKLTSGEVVWPLCWGERKESRRNTGAVSRALKVPTRGVHCSESSTHSAVGGTLGHCDPAKECEEVVKIEVKTDVWGMAKEN